MKTYSFVDKYRPLNFSGIIGNKVIKQSLSSTKFTNRIPKAILISGKYGTGKTTFARSYAKLANCTNPKQVDGIYDSCGVCPTCLEIVTGKPIDYTEINAADQRSIDDMRSLISRCEMGLTDLNYRIVIIDECQQLRSDSQNILLKPLEDPNSNTIFIFCTTNPDKIISTIKSRCRRLYLKSIPEKMILGHLEFICEREKIDYQEDALLMICNEANGSMRDAINILDQCSGQGEITVKVVSPFTSIINLEIIYLLLDNIVKLDMSEIYNIIENLDKRNIPSEKLIDLMIVYLGDVLIFMETKNQKLLKYKNNEYYEKVRGHSEILKKREIIRCFIKIFLNTYASLESYPRQKHLLNLAFSECGQMIQQ